MLVGRAAEHHWTPPGASEAAAVLNRTRGDSNETIFPHVEIQEIGGLNDLATPGEAAHKRVGADGEVAHPNFRGGKTYLYNGIIRATGMRELDEYRGELRAAFADQSASGRMDHIPRTASGEYDASDARYYEGQPLGLEMADLPPDRSGRWRSTFTLALRNHAGVYYEELTLSSFKQHIDSFDPWGYWPLNSADGVTDQSGNARNGTGNGGVSVGAAASLTALAGDSSTDFDTNDYVSVGSHPFSGAVTFAAILDHDFTDSSGAWMGSADVTGKQVIVSAGSSAGGLYIATTFDPQDEGAGAAITGSADPDLSTPYALVVSFDPDANSGSMFANGVAMTVTGAGTKNFHASPGNLVVGGAGVYPAGVIGGFDGKIAHAAAFQGLTATEQAVLAEIYAAALTGTRTYT